MRIADHRLDRRAGLPEALRVLAEAWPRARWEGHENFGEMLAFWMDRHAGFRGLSARLADDARSFLDGYAEPRVFARGVGRLCNLFLNQLHAHHHIEDDHFFPLLAECDARLTMGFALLEADHAVLAERIDALAAAGNALIAAVREGGNVREPAGVYLGEVEALGRLLERHLEDEEELVVPVVLEYGPPFLG